MDIEKLVADEAAWLARQEVGVLNEMLDIYRETSAELEQKLKGMERDSYTRRHTQAIGAQLDVLIQEMGDRQAAALGKSVQLTFKEQLFREKDAWQGLEQAFGSPEVAKQFAGITPIVPQRAVKALLKATDVSIKGFTADLSKDVRRTAAKSMLAGEGMKDTIKRVRRVTGSGTPPARVQLISRMETARASNTAKQEYIDQVNSELPELELWQMVKGRVDRGPKTRNHWVTWALSGTVRNVTKGEFFEIHLAAIALVKAQYTQTTGRKASDAGVLMKSFELGLRCLTIPAHYGDRDTIVGWRPAWGELAGPVKHPQGAIKMGFEEEDVDEGQTPPPKPEPEPEEQRKSVEHGGSGLPNDYHTSHLQPTGSLRGKKAKEVRALLREQGQAANAIEKAYNKEAKARAKSIQYIQELNEKHGSVPTPLAQRYKKLIKEEKLAFDQHAELMHQMGQESRAAISLPGPARVTLAFEDAVSPELREKVESVALAHSQLLGERMPAKSIIIREVEGGPKFLKDDESEIIQVRRNVHPRYIAHELTHFFESHDSAALQASLETQDNRFRGKNRTEYKRLVELDPLGDYERPEKARIGGFKNPASGKTYYPKLRGETERSEPFKKGDPAIGSEFLSTGFEQMYENPALFAVTDPRFFDFIWGIMHGENPVPK